MLMNLYYTLSTGLKNISPIYLHFNILLQHFYKINFDIKNINRILENMKQNIFQRSFSIFENMCMQINSLLEFILNSLFKYLIF